MRGTYRYYTRNASELPVFEVTVTIRPPSSGDKKFYESFTPVLAPASDADNYTFATESPMRSWQIELRFRDAAGQCWVRDHFGRLKTDSWQPAEWDFDETDEK
jgi:hypothetical protein